jgi:hypothetical protein
MTDNAMALGKADFAALDLIKALPDQAAKVAARANAGKGIVSRKIADNLVMAEKAHYGADGRVYLGQPEEWEYPEGEGDHHLGQAIEAGDPPTSEPDTTTPEEDPQEPTPQPEKVNGRKAKADASPYSTATPTNRIKRHGKSRRTGTMTEIEDGLAKGSTFKVKGSGRYAVRCLTHKAETTVPDMTTAKPLQARTDQFCPKCADLVAKGEKHTDEAKAS